MFRIRGICAREASQKSEQDIQDVQDVQDKRYLFAVEYQKSRNGQAFTPQVGFKPKRPFRVTQRHVKVPIYLIVRIAEDRESKK